MDKETRKLIELGKEARKKLDAYSKEMCRRRDCALKILRDIKLDK